MRAWTYAIAAATAAAWLGLPAVAVAQDMPPMPKPGPEHKMLAEDVGTWDATIEIFAPDGSTITSKGVETNTLGCGGLCLVSDFKGEMMPGTSFHGHGVTTWDPAKKRYVGSWTDSMSMGLGVGESTYDPATRTVTGSMTMPDASGAMATMKSKVEYKDGQRVMTMYTPGPGGKDVMTMRITYAKQKKS